VGSFDPARPDVHDGRPSTYEGVIGIMRLSRSGLVERLLRSGAAPVVLLEAPSGYGKSWLMRQSWGPASLKWRAALGPLTGDAFDSADKVVLDDAHLLSDEEVERLVEHIEFSDGHVPLLIAGRLLDARLHEVAELVDGVILDISTLSIGVDEFAELLPQQWVHSADQLVGITEGEVRATAATLAHVDRTGGDPVTFASRVVRANCVAVCERLRSPDVAIVSVLARCPGLGEHLLESIGGRDVVARLLAAGAPLRRHSTDGFEIVAAESFKAFPVDPTVASRFAAELVHDRPIDAIALLVDAGEFRQAAQVMSALTESGLEQIEPRRLLALLARFGASVERNPALLLVRAGASTAVGRPAQAIHDVDLAMSLADQALPALRRRITVEAARARLVEGRHDEAVQAAEAALSDIEPGEERTYARAHEVLAECAATSNNVAVLQRAAESFRVAAAAWEVCGEHTSARACRRSLAMGVLLPLARFDQALAQLTPLLDALDQSDNERTMTILSEGFVLACSGRVDAAAERFNRANEIGLMLDNPRLIAAAAWGRATVACRRGDLDLTVHYISEADNTSLDDSGDTLGLAFLCDATEMLGALGDFELATRYCKRATDSAALFPDEVTTTRFILDARCGELGDVDAQAERASPLQRWRVLLVSAHATARAGDLRRARELLDDCERELMAMGLASADLLGEAREYEALRRLLDAAEPAPAPAPVVTSPPMTRPVSRQVRVFGSPIRVRIEDDEVAIPSGNPQRLLGVVAAAGGSATFDHIGESMWPEEDVNTSRTRLRNVLMRLRKAVGDVLVRSEVGVRLAADVTCDLHEFDRAALDAISSTRADPEMAGRLANHAVQMAAGTTFADFEYEEWAIRARRAAEQRLINLLDLLSIQAEDDGDLPRAQAMAERALQLDRYTDSRYVRLAELLVLQNRNAAAVTVLDDAAAVVRTLNQQPNEPFETRRREILKRTATGT